MPECCKCFNLPKIFTSIVYFFVKKGLMTVILLFANSLINDLILFTFY